MGLDKRITEKIKDYEAELRKQYPKVSVRYLLGTPYGFQFQAADENIAPEIPPGEYVYPDITPIDIGSTLFLDPELTEPIFDNQNSYRHLFTSTGSDTNYFLSYNESGEVIFYQQAK